MAVLTSLSLSSCKKDIAHPASITDASVSLNANFTTTTLEVGSPITLTLNFTGSSRNMLTAYKLIRANSTSSTVVASGSVLGTYQTRTYYDNTLSTVGIYTYTVVLTTAKGEVSASRQVNVVDSRGTLEFSIPFSEILVTGSTTLTIKFEGNVNDKLLGYTLIKESPNQPSNTTTSTGLSAVSYMADPIQLNFPVKGVYTYTIKATTTKGEVMKTVTITANEPYISTNLTLTTTVNNKFCFSVDESAEYSIASVNSRVQEQLYKKIDMIYYVTASNTLGLAAPVDGSNSLTWPTKRKTLFKEANVGTMELIQKMQDSKEGNHAALVKSIYAIDINETNGKTSLDVVINSVVEFVTEDGLSGFIIFALGNGPIFIMLTE